jgi:hypothetical protein
MMHQMDNDQQKLNEWFQDYALYSALRGPQLEEDVEGPGPDFDDEPMPAEGQIRLWPPGGMQEEPVYGVLVSGGYGTWQVIPFSPLATPAVEQEMLLRSDPPVRVLQGWNRRTLSTSEAKRSWKADELQDLELFSVRLWLGCVDSGTPCPDSLKDKVGPPLRHPQDPRQGYFLEEADRVDACLGEAVASYGGAMPHQRAAEKPEPYGTDRETD